MYINTCSTNNFSALSKYFQLQLKPFTDQNFLDTLPLFIVFSNVNKIN